MPHVADALAGQSHRRPDVGTAWPWEKIERTVRSYHPVLAAIVAELRRRKLDESMHGALGMDGLYLCMSRTWPRDGDVLRIGETPEGGVRLTYLSSVQEKPARLSKPYAFSKSYPADEAWAALVRFWIRAHWLPKEHPKLAELA